MCVTVYLLTVNKPHQAHSSLAPFVSVFCFLFFFNLTLHEFNFLNPPIYFNCLPAPTVSRSWRQTSGPSPPAPSLVSPSAQARWGPDEQLAVRRSVVAVKVSQCAACAARVYWIILLSRLTAAARFNPALFSLFFFLNHASFYLIRK